MKTETCLEIQASVDGELDPKRQAALDTFCQGNPDARALRESLRGLRAAVQNHEPEFRVEDSREFYWGQIQRRIAQAERAEPAARSPRLSPFASLTRWLAPVAGLAAVTLVFMLRDNVSLEQTTMSSAEAAQADLSTVVYRSDADGVTVHWIN